MSREFSGSGYLKYDIISKNPVINSDKDTLKLSFITVQPTGMFINTQNSGKELGDYITLELVGGRLRYAVTCDHEYYIYSGILLIWWCL